MNLKMTPAVIMVAILIHRFLGKITPLVMRAVLYSLHATTSVVLAFVMVALLVEIMT